jgi:dihydrofolate reductase
MSKVFFSVTMSLDGYLAPESRFDDVGDKRFFAQWMKLQEYVFEQKFFRDNLKLGGEGLTGEDNRILEHTFTRTGTTILGKRMFDMGERMWPAEAPFHTPVFVLTRAKREPWARPGGTTFFFVNDGVHSALEQARKAAGTRDIRIGGGARVLREYLKAGLVDEFHLAVSPVLFGGGEPLFAGLDLSELGIELTRTVGSPKVSHLFYSVKR